MALKNQNLIKMTSLLLIVFTFFLSLKIYSQEEKEEGMCEEALKRCMTSAFKLLPYFSNFYVYSISCAAGYVFCKKYIEKK